MKHENLLLTLAAIFTWALVAYIDLVKFNHAAGSMGWLENGWSLLGYLVFLVALLPLATGYLGKEHWLIASILLLVQLVVTLVLLLVNQEPMTAVLLVVWAGQLPDFFSRRVAITWVVASAILFYAIMYFYWQASFYIITGLVYLGFQLFALSSSFARVNERNAREHTEYLNQQLQATRILLAQSSRQDERVRISRDLHDILGHQLTALNLQLEILQHKVPEALCDKVQQSKSLAKELLENIRQVVRDQRNLLSLDIRQAVQALAMRIPQIQLHIEGDLRLDSVHLAEQLVLCIQEGMSNALRHGGATQIKLGLQQHNNCIDIVLEDNGRGLNLGGQKNGMGLQGMRERLKSYGGQVELSALSQGCCLYITAILEGKT